MKKIFTILGVTFSMLLSAQQADNIKTIDFGDKYGDYSYLGYYNLDTNQETLIDRLSWNIAFYTKDNNQVDIRVNPGGATTLYYPAETVLNLEDYTKNPSSDNLIEYVDLFENWGAGGAFQQNANINNDLDYGWGIKDNNGVISGNKVIIIQTARGKYLKVKINHKNEFGYDFSYSQYSRINGWSDVTTVNLPMNTDKLYTYYNLVDNEIVEAEENLNSWDLFFTKYSEKVAEGEGFNGLEYYFGAFQNPEVKVAKVLENETNMDVTDSRYEEKANTIANKWNTLDFSNFNEEIKLTSDRFYFIKNKKAIYRLEFTGLLDMFHGHKTTFETVKLGDLSVSDFEHKNQVYLASNPTRNKTIELVFNIKDLQQKNSELFLFSIDGRQVYHEKMNTNQSFFSKKINLSNLAEGVYILNVLQGNYKKTFKVILK